MSQALEKPEIQVSVHPVSIQDRQGSSVDGVRLYSLRGKTAIAGIPKNVVFLFPSPDFSPPALVHDRLAGHTVGIHRLVWVEGIDHYLAAPTPASLQMVSRDPNVGTDGSVVAIPGHLRRPALFGLSHQTDLWFSEWVQDFTLRRVLESWDPFLLLDPDKFPNDYLNRQAVNGVSRLIDKASKTQSLDFDIASNLMTEVVAPGQEYAKWLANLRSHDGSFFAEFSGRTPRQRYQDLFDATVARGKLLSGPLGKVLYGNPYNLDKQSLGQGQEDIKHKYNQATDFLSWQARRFMGGTPERSTLDRLGITAQLAREHALWFLGKTIHNSEILDAVARLRAISPFIPALLRAIETTEEGQAYSDYLRTKFITDPQKESYKPAA